MKTPVEVRVGDSLFWCEDVCVEWQTPGATLASPFPVPGRVVITCNGAVEYTLPPTLFGVPIQADPYLPPGTVELRSREQTVRVVNIGGEPEEATPE